MSNRGGMQILNQMLSGRRPLRQNSINRELEEAKQSVTCAICVDLYNDPRLLDCSHTYCKGCLISYLGDDSSTTKECPKCRALTVPKLQDVSSLPRNDFAAQVVRLIMANDSDHGASGEPVIENDDMFVGDYLPPPSSENRKTSWKKIGFTAAAGVVVGLMTGGLPGLLAGSAVAGLGLLGNEGINIQKRKLEAVQFTCNACHHVGYNERYMCGMCDEFMLCLSCFESSNRIRLHDSGHIFLKLQTKPKRHLPDGPLLKDKAKEIAESFVFSSNKHTKAYIHTPDRLITVPGIKCKGCDNYTIQGIRYKCGLCLDYDLCEQCERRSSDIHEATHVFLALPYKAEVNIIATPLLRAKLF